MIGRRLRSRLSTAVVYTLGLAAVGVVYPLSLSVSGALPAFDAIVPFLSVGIVVGFVADRALGARGLVGVLDGDAGRLTSFAARGRRWYASQYEWPWRSSSAGTRRGESSRPVDTRHDRNGVDTSDSSDVEDDGDGDDDGGDENGRDWGDWWSLYSLASMVGITSWLEFTAPWFVGFVLGVIWIVVAMRIVRACSPCSDGMSRPPRGVPATESE